MLILPPFWDNHENYLLHQFYTSFVHCVWYSIMFICLFKWYFFPLILLCWAQYISDYSLHKRQAYISKIHTMGKSIHMKWPISSWTIISKILSNFIQNSLDAWDRIIMKFANFYSSFFLENWKSTPYCGSSTTRTTYTLWGVRVIYISFISLMARPL